MNAASRFLFVAVEPVAPWSRDVEDTAAKEEALPGIIISSPQSRPPAQSEFSVTDGGEYSWSSKTLQ